MFRPLQLLLWGEAMNGLSNAVFPSLVAPTAAKWAPVLFRPMLGSPEQYVVAVAAVDGSRFHIESANQWSRLECLFGRASGTLVVVAQAAIRALEQDLSARGPVALSEYREVAASIDLGEIRDGEASSVQEVARVWMRHLSSLYSAGALTEAPAMDMIEHEELVGASERKSKEKLPDLVMEFTSASTPALRGFFATPKKKKDPYDIHIDYSGKRIVANFETLTTSGFATSVARIKHRMWDLKVSRDGPERTGKREHQMFVKHADKAELNNTQIEKIESAIYGLEQQADQEQIRLLPMTSVADISNRLVKTELAA